jgi:hypothetical protein
VSVDIRPGAKDKHPSRLNELSFDRETVETLRDVQQTGTLHACKR